MINMKTKKIFVLISIITIFLLSTTSFTTSVQTINYESNQGKKIKASIQSDIESILPDWQDGDYHDYYETTEKLFEFNNNYSSLVHVFSIGNSVLGRPIWCIRITNENNNSSKYSCLYDGLVHGNEWEGGEACLYFAEYLLINFGKNNTITELLNNSEVYLVPVVNPDGRQKDKRHNHHGVDTNKNFDVDFGSLLGGNLRVGKWFPFDYILLPFYPRVLVKTGRYPFSEPESRALRDLMIDLKTRNFSFYLTLHTATHYFGRPSDKVINSEYEITTEELEVF